MVFDVFCMSHLSNFSVADFDREYVVVKDTVGIRLAVRHEKNFLAIWRPINRMFVVITTGELANILRSDIGDEDVRAAIIVEPRHPFGGRRLVEVASDNDGIATGGLGFRARRGRDERDLFAVGRPRDAIAGRRQRMIGSLRGRDEHWLRTVRANDHQTRLARLARLARSVSDSANT